MIQTFKDLREDNPVFAEIIKEQFKTVGVEITDEEDLTDGWVDRHEWTEEQEQAFEQWVFDHVCNLPTKDFKSIFRGARTKKQIRLNVKWIISQWGFNVPNRKDFNYEI